MEALTSSIFRNNTIAANDIAIQAFSSATEDTFTGNNFIHNLSPLQLIGRETGIRWDEGRRGNYWSEYDGYDLDGDGIGDVPFKIQNAFEHLEGNYPRLRIYLFSPASQALAAAERIFPVLERPRAYDRFPIMRPAPLPVREPGRADRSTGVALPFALSFAILAGSVAMIAAGRRPK
jgi:nitrous oxidase accessory protein